MSHDRTAITLVGTVEKVIPAIGEYRAEKAQITVVGAKNSIGKFASRTGFAMRRVVLYA